MGKQQDHVAELEGLLASCECGAIREWRGGIGGSWIEVFKP